jgi:hypothetical protein
MEISPRDLVMDTIIAFMVGIQIYMILDEVSDGNFSREFSVKLTKWKAKLRKAIEIEERMQRDTGATIFEAITIVEDDGPGNIDPGFPKR